jgi:TolB-like protein
MKKLFFAALLTLFTSAVVTARDNLAILPFSGGEGEDGETIAELFSFDPELNAAFIPVPRTKIRQAIRSEQRFQTLSGMTDPDTIAALGQEVGAQYVVAGSISRLGDRKLLIIGILKIDELRQVAGDIQTYQNEEEIRNKLPAMVRNILAAIRLDTSLLPHLAVVPVRLLDGVEKQEADTLAQILGIHILRTEKYAVYPRTSSLEQVRAEFDTQYSGVTADEELADLGKGANPELVLSVTARKLGPVNMFNAAIINRVSGAQETGSSAEYQNMGDAIGAMETLAREITGVAELERQRRAGEEAKARTARSRFFSAGGAIGSSFAPPWFILSANGTFSFFPYTFLEAGMDFGFVHGYDSDEKYFSLYPFVHFNVFFPFPLGRWKAAVWGGAGAGLMAAFYEEAFFVPALDIGLGFRAGRGRHYLTFGWTIRTNFTAANHKLALGYSYRFN